MFRRHLKRVLLSLFLLLVLSFYGFAGTKTLITGLRCLQEEGKLKVLVDLQTSSSFEYKVSFLKADVTTGRPARILIDICPAEIHRGATRTLEVGTPFCDRVRLGQYDRGTVRLVFEVKGEVEVKVSQEQSIHQLIVYVYPKVLKDISKNTLSTSPLPSFVLVLDPGHGGKDPGAIGPTGLKEKDVVLKVAKLVKEKAEKQLGWSVYLTREDDLYLPLEERTAFANQKGGDLFVSIHCNASYNKETRGVETYFLSFTTDREALRLAARENGVPPSQIDALQLILYDLMLRAKVEESEKLAQFIQTNIVNNLKNNGNHVKDLGVKRAPFIVLVGAKMPSVLIEIGFITNPEEEEKLRDLLYLDIIADGILSGLLDYVNTYIKHPTSKRHMNGKG